MPALNLFLFLFFPFLHCIVLPTGMQTPHTVRPLVPSVPALVFQPTRKNASVEARIIITPSQAHLKVRLAYHYTVNDKPLDSLSFFLAPEMKVESVEGKTVKGFYFDTGAKPFSTLRVYFRRRLEKGQQTRFSIAYSGKPAKGFFTQQQWIDIDPDFMILPLFANLENFTYRLQASFAGPDKKAGSERRTGSESSAPGASTGQTDFTFFDLQSGIQTKTLRLTSVAANYYFNSILAGTTV